jgi:hypothetical protein
MLVKLNTRGGRMQVGFIPDVLQFLIEGSEAIQIVATTQLGLSSNRGEYQAT